MISTCWLAACGRLGFDLAGDESPALPDANAGDQDAGEVSTPRWVFIAIQGNSQSFIQRLEYDPDVSISSRLTRTTDAIRIDSVEGSRIRGLTILDDRTLLAGAGGTNAILVPVDITSMAPSQPHNLGTLLRNSHGHCVLPSGGVIVGEYRTAPGNAVVELAREGDNLSFARTVYSTVHNGGTLSECVALSSTALLITDQNATNDRDGDIVRVELVGDTWSVTDRLDLSDLGDQTSVYSFDVVGQFLYAFPIRRHLNQIKSVLRCPTTGIQSSNCVELAVLPEDNDPDDNGPSALQGAVAVPGTSDIMFATNSKLYIYDIDADAWQEAYDMAANFTDLVTVNGELDSIDVVRGLVVY